MSSVFQQLSSSHIITETWCIPLPFSFTSSHPHSVFLIGVQHPPTSCQEGAPSLSSKPGNYCLGKLMPRRPSQTTRTSQRAMPRLPSDREGKGSQTLWWSHSHPPHSVLCYSFFIMELTNMKSSRPQGLEGEWREGKRKKDAAKEGLRVREQQITESKERAECE